METSSIQVPPGMENFTVGIIGMGAMGKMYAQRLSDAGWRREYAAVALEPLRLDQTDLIPNRINGCDREENYESLKEEFASRSNVQIFRNGHLVSRSSDWIMYSVEAANIDRIAATYAPSTKMGAIVGGQTSCKKPEIDALEKYLPADAHIVSCHSLHGPGTDTRDQPLVLIKHRASDEAFKKVETVLRCLQSRHVYLTAQEHDHITADTQAVTHAAFLSMGKAWNSMKEYPWETARYIGGIENVKINIMLRIYSQKWHVYAGLAILNPEARKQIEQYAKSTTELYKLMLESKGEELKARVYAAKERVFGNGTAKKDELLLDDEVLDQFSLGKKPELLLPNNHLSLLAMVDCWSALGIVPYDHMICSTPIFRMWLGVTESLFRNQERLDEAIRVAIDDTSFRGDDLEFTFAARGWAECVSLGHFETWKERFMATQRFFEPRFAGAIEVGNDMLKVLAKSRRGSR